MANDYEITQAIHIGDKEVVFGVDGGILKDRNAMNFYCANQPGSRMESRYNGNSFGFRADTENYAYLIRCNPQKGDYNFSVFPYIAK